MRKSFARYSNIQKDTFAEFAIGRIGRIVVSSCPETDYMQGSVTVGSSTLCQVLACPTGRTSRRDGLSKGRAFRREGFDFELSKRARSGRGQP